MGIKVDIGSADSQGSTANSVLSSRVNYYNDVITAFNNLITEGELKGKAYDSAKSYAENIMVSLLRGVILFSESLGGKAGELPTLYYSQVGGESLDEEILQQQIEAKNTTISTYESILYSLYNLKDVDPIYISNVRGIISNATSKRDELQRKLEKLQSFASSTSGQFSDSESLQSLVFQGFEQVTGDFGKFDGTFKVEGQAPWANNINNEWTKRSEVIQNYQNVVDKIKNKTELDDNDIKAIAKYEKRYPGKELPENVKDAVQKYVESKVNINVDLSGLGEFLEIIRDTSLEEIAKDTIDKLSSKNPNLLKHFKQFTISEFDIPIPGTNSSLGISGISSIFMGMDFLNNLQDENAGRAFTHTVANVVTTTVVAETLTVGTAVVAEAVGMTTVAAAVVSNPIGWAIGVGILAGVVANVAYENNFLGIKTIANEMGDNLNKSISDVGKAFDSGIKSIQKVFGW